MPSASAATVTVHRSARDDVAATRFSLPVLDPLHRSAEVVAREEHDLLVARQVGLLAEAAADVAHPDADLALGDAGDPARHGAHVVGRLGRHPHVEGAAARVPRRDDAAGLHRDGEVAVLDERLGHDVRRACRGSGASSSSTGITSSRARLLSHSPGCTSSLLVERGLVVDDRRERLDVERRSARRRPRRAPRLVATTTAYGSPT